MLKQISLFAANTRGALGKITNALAKEDINIYTMLATDSAEFGIIRLILDKPDKGLAVLKEAGYQCRIDMVTAVDMGSDTPGTLDKILTHLSQANVFVRYLYISFDRKTSSPIVVLRTDEPETETFLKGKGYTLLDRF
ncbi:amino acid-binding protein [Acidaminococcus timonensis]|uniref:amino acid-binding protein n=1 Tax=Acidaminococcus timonensis TaxID=1871002 RepID=UPI0029439651|nr:amino acid-binding protein [Acidaminococcus timonensis]